MKIKILKEKTVVLQKELQEMLTKKEFILQGIRILNRDLEITNKEIKNKLEEIQEKIEIRITEKGERDE